MRLKIATDYGIRVMRYLFDKEELMTASEIAEAAGISYQYLNKVLRRLKKTGMVEVIQGRTGGYKIAGNFRNTTLYSIVKAMEGDIRIQCCLDDNPFCSGNSTEACLVRDVFESLQKDIINSLNSVKLSDVSREIYKAIPNQITCIEKGEIYETE